MADVDRYLIVKRGAYYRPNECGYTTDKARAGRYTRAEAEAITHPNGPDGPRDGMTYVRDDARPMADVDTSAEAVDQLAAQHWAYAAGWRDIDTRACMFHERTEQMLRALAAERDALRDNVLALLNSGSPCVVRVHEGGGPEDIAMSLAVTFAKLQAAAAAARRAGIEAAIKRAECISIAIINGLHAPNSVPRCILTAGDITNAIRALLEEPGA